MSRIDRVVEAARSRLQRISAREVPAALGRGAVLVDIRPHAQHEREGGVPAALVIERNVLEWGCWSGMRTGLRSGSPGQPVAERR